MQLLPTASIKIELAPGNSEARESMPIARIGGRYVFFFQVIMQSYLGDSTLP